DHGETSNKKPPMCVIGLSFFRYCVAKYLKTCVAARLSIGVLAGCVAFDPSHLGPPWCIKWGPAHSPRAQSCPMVHLATQIEAK
ncbi:unnamed protein product, partial [Amoebophrya sp. A25]